MEAFDPLQSNFVLLRDFEFPGGVAVYEYRNHGAVDGGRDYLRLNLYLSKDGNFVTIWWGFVEPLGAEMEFTTGKHKVVERPEDLEFLRSYNEDLFRGYTDSAAAALRIFKALRIGSGRQYARPQVLCAGRDNELLCETMEGASGSRIEARTEGRSTPRAIIFACRRQQGSEAQRPCYNDRGGPPHLGR